MSGYYDDNFGAYHIEWDECEGSLCPFCAPAHAAPGANLA